MISIFALGSDLPQIEVIRSALSEERTLVLSLIHKQYCDHLIKSVGKGR
ncbi:Uncharacterised protein [Klebsiella pneumoniae]|nr:Uncharacterised protein [Klebsiella pneumoniae]